MKYVRTVLPGWTGWATCVPLDRRKSGDWPWHTAATTSKDQHAVVSISARHFRDQAERRQELRFELSFIYDNAKQNHLLTIIYKCCMYPLNFSLGNRHSGCHDTLAE